MTIQDANTRGALGKLVKLDEPEVKSIWGREEEFSRWMATHIEVLNEALGLQIEIAELEGAVGNFRVDLAGNDSTTRTPVIIENQFGKSDHDHLGKLITYSAGRDAGIIVWVASEFEQPHRAAIEWLNTVTSEEMRFYAVKLDVLRIDDSKPAPMYNVLVEPPAGKRPVPAAEPSARGVAYKEFWAKFLNYLKEKHPGLTGASKVGPDNWFGISAGVSGFQLVDSFSGDGQFRVELSIYTGSKDQNQRAFADLRTSEASINENLGYTLTWDDMPDRKGCRAYIARDGTIYDSPEQLQEYIAWGAERMSKLREVFRPLLKELDLS